MARAIQTISALLVIVCTVQAAEGASGRRCSLQGKGIDRCIILRAPADVIPLLAQEYGLIVVRGLSPLDPDSVLVEAPSTYPPGDTLAALLRDPEVTQAEAVALTSLVETGAGAAVDVSELDALDSVALEGVYAGEESAFYSVAPWNGYASQTAVSLIKLDLVRNPLVPETYGAGTIAVIDTGVDPDHPLLRGALVPGYDFLLDQDGIPSEWSALDSTTRNQTEQDLRTIADQSYTSIVEGGGATTNLNSSTRLITDQSYTSIVEQSYTSIVESTPLPSAFGHGTMVAGLVRLVAPGAKILPIRAFGGDGTASTADVIAAIYFAIDHGADVINMSFSTDAESPELTRAIHHARQAGVVCVSSAGNRGTTELTYPAALDDVLGVASTDSLDRLSLFSNYGPELVALGAPGEAIVSLYPGGLYAGGWGTSFSSGLVSGAVALLHSITGSDSLTTVTFAKAKSAFDASSDEPDPSVPAGALGSGRLDVEEAFVHGLSNNGNGL